MSVSQLDGRAQQLLPRALRPFALWYAAACAAVLVALGLRYHGGTAAAGLDHRILRVLPWPPDARDQVLLDAERVVNPTSAALLALGLALVCALRRWWHGAVLALAGPALTGLLTEAGKAAVGRTLDGYWAYPSGHTSGATSVLVVLALLVIGPVRAHPLRAALVALAAVTAGAAAVGLMMVTLRAHYPTDVVGGYCAGIAVTIGTARVLDAVAARRRPAGAGRPAPG